MKVRGIRSRGVTGLFDLNIDLSSAVTVIYGDNGSGKSLVCRVIGDSFAPTLIRSTVSDLRGEFWVEFDLGVELGVVTISGGKVSRLQGMKRLVRVDGGLENAVLCYGSGRLSGSIEMGDGVRFIRSILHDLHIVQQRGCIIVIDDFELGLSLENQKLFFNHLYKACLSKGNQLIITTRDGSFVSWVSGLNVPTYELSGSIDILSVALKDIGH